MYKKPLAAQSPSARLMVGPAGAFLLRTIVEGEKVHKVVRTLVGK